MTHFAPHKSPFVPTSIRRVAMATLSPDAGRRVIESMETGDGLVTLD
jgi:hypothetical protein